MPQIYISSPDCSWTPSRFIHSFAHLTSPFKCLLGILSEQEWNFWVFPSHPLRHSKSTRLEADGNFIPPVAQTKNLGVILYSSLSQPLIQSIRNFYWFYLQIHISRIWPPFSPSQLLLVQIIIVFFLDYYSSLWNDSVSSRRTACPPHKQPEHVSPFLKPSMPSQLIQSQSLHSPTWATSFRPHLWLHLLMAPDSLYSSQAPLTPSPLLDTPLS